MNRSGKKSSHYKLLVLFIRLLSTNATHMNPSNATNVRPHPQRVGLFKSAKSDILKMKWTTITVSDIIQEVKVLNDVIQNNLEQ